MRKLATLAAIVTATTFGLAGAANAAGPSYSFDGDLIGYWSFDDETDPTNDDSGNGNNGKLICETAIDPLCVDPAFDTDAADVPPSAGNVASIEFNGADQIVEVDDDDALTPSGNKVTIAAWIKPAALGASQFICGKHNDGGANREYSLIMDSGGLVSLFVHTTDDGSFVSASSAAVATASVWTHVAGVYDGDGSGLQMYINGIASGAPFAHTGNLVNGAGRFSVGAQIFGTQWDRFFDGHIDECRVYDVALTPDQIALLASGQPEVEPGLTKVLTSGDLANAIDPLCDDENTVEDCENGNPAADPLVDLPDGEPDLVVQVGSVDRTFADFTITYVPE